jgi:flagellar hook assembly protein FlgD
MTQVAFNLSAANQVTVSVFNALGQLVETINTTDLEAGKHVLSFNTADYNSGIYTVKVQGNGFSAAEKFIVE